MTLFQKTLFSSSVFLFISCGNEDNFLNYPDANNSFSFDFIKPILTLNGENNITINKGEVYLDAGAVAMDERDGNITDKIKTFSTVNTTNPGIYSVIYTVKDRAGNVANIIQRTINIMGDNDTNISYVPVKDRSKPILEIIGDTNITIEKGINYLDAGAIAYDDIDGNITDKIKTFSTVDTSNEGVYSVVYTVKDNAENVANIMQRTITITGDSDINTAYSSIADTSKPILKIIGDVKITADQGIDYVDEGATAYDDEDGDISNKIKTFSTVDSLREGIYTVIYMVQDNADNMADIIHRTVHVTRFCDNKTAITRERLIEMIQNQEDVTQVNTCKITNMNNLFEYQTEFNQDISHWDTSRVTSMRQMFRKTISFNQSLASWDVSSVTNMDFMFAGAISFDQPLNNWDVSNVTNMKWMFASTIFNQPLSHWDVSNVRDMSLMFYHTSSFDQDIHNWNTKNVKDMRSMFNAAISFNQDISKWNISNIIYSKGFNVNNNTLEDSYNPFFMKK